MSALATENRDRLRRWAASLALALLLHGGIVVALLSWRNSVTAPSAPGPAGAIIIDLAPSPSEPVAPQSERVPAPAGEPAERPPEQLSTNGASQEPTRPAEETTAEKAAKNGEETTADRAAKNGEETGEQKTAPAEAPPGLIAPAPSENAEGEDSGDERASGGGGVAPAAPDGEAMGGPIDTRMSVASRSGWRSKKKAGRGADGKSIVLIRPSKGSGGLGHPRDLSAQSPAINAIGAHIQDRVRAAIAREGAKNAVGGSAANNVGGASAHTAERTVTNAIGITMHFRPRIPGTVTGGGQPVGVMALAGNARTVAAVNGTGMTRIGSVPGVIGGAARQLAGALNGTSFRPRHP